MKKTFSIFLVIVILSQSIMQLGILAYYQWNITYISQQLCENRNNPKMHCNGKCYLSKQLKKAEEGKGKHTKNILKEKEELVFQYQVIVTDVVILTKADTHYIPFLAQPNFADYSNNLLKPPVA